MSYTPDGCAAIQRYLDTLESGTGRNVTAFSKGKCRDLHLGRNNHQYMQGTSQLEGRSAEKDLGVLVDNKLDHKPAAHPYREGGQQYLGLWDQPDQGKWSFFSAQHWWGHKWMTASGSDLPSTRNIWTYRSDSRIGPQRLRDWSISCKRRAETFQPGEKTWGFLIGVYKYLMGGKEEGADSSQWCPQDKRHKIKHN